MPPQKRGASAPSRDEGVGSNEEEAFDLFTSNKRPCRRSLTNSAVDAARSLAPSPDCIAMTSTEDEDNASSSSCWWLRRHPTRTNAMARCNSTHEWRCRFCQGALPGGQPSILLQHDESMHQQQEQDSTARPRPPPPSRPFLTLLNFYTAAPTAEAHHHHHGPGRNNEDDSMLGMPVADAGNVVASRASAVMPVQQHSEQQQQYQCSYCDRTDQCGACTVRCDPCGGLIFCLFCRAYDTHGTVVCLVCRNGLTDNTENETASSSLGTAVVVVSPRNGALTEAEEEDAMEMG